MIEYIIRRLIQGVIILILITLLVFLAMRLLPGDPIYMIMTSGEATTLTPEDIEAARHEFGLDRPIIVQYIDWIYHLSKGDLGMSLVKRYPVAGILGQGIPITFNLAIAAFIFSLILGIPAGVICAIRRGGWPDTVLTILANTGVTVPQFWLGILLIYFLALKLGWLPVQGYVSPLVDLVQNIRLAIMPVLCIAVTSLASITRQTRSSMLEVMRQDYIRTAWSKGLRERAVVIRHALKNGFIPVITLADVAFYRSKRHGYSRSGF